MSILNRDSDDLPFAGSTQRRVPTRRVAAILLGIALGAVALFLVAGLALEALRPPIQIERAEQSGPNADSDASGQPVDAGAGTEGAAPGEQSLLRVHVVGCVGAPGVYELPEGSRAQDAVEAAGGLTEEADPAALNLAREVKDGEQVRVPSREEAASASAPSPSSGGGSAASASAGPVDLNRATREELMALPGVGEATADRIIASRTQDGPFSSKEDLMRIEGIGEKKFAKLEPLIEVR